MAAAASATVAILVVVPPLCLLRVSGRALLVLHRTGRAALMSLFQHECRPPVPWFFTRTWTCHCGQQFVVRPVNRQTPDGRAIAEAVPTGKATKR